jgi:hypothetical protein
LRVRTRFGWGSVVVSAAFSTLTALSAFAAFAASTFSVFALLFSFTAGHPTAGESDGQSGGRNPKKSASGASSHVSGEGVGVRKAGGPSRAVRGVSSGFRK